MEEEAYEPEPEPTYLCKCMFLGDETPPPEPVIIPPRKQKILSTVSRTENYLRERRIPELIRFLLTKLIAERSDKPVVYLEELLNDCMLFRAGFGSPPVLYEDRHLEAIIKSFDPGQRGWLSEGQIRRLYATLGLTPVEFFQEKVSTDVILRTLKKAQGAELLELLRAGQPIEEIRDDESSVDKDSPQDSPTMNKSTKRRK